ncbi:MAG: DALR anticodon-binding domain-containing protein, partial [Thermoanaerobaculia bacterium]
FVPLSLAFKRINNILAQATDISGEPEPSLMVEDAEKNVASDYFQAKDMLDELISARRYEEALCVMASLGPSLDRFFVEVMVLAEDEGLRRNRLALLRSIRDQFSRVAKFNEIQG